MSIGFRGNTPGTGGSKVIIGATGLFIHPRRQAEANRVRTIHDKHGRMTLHRWTGHIRLNNTAADCDDKLKCFYDINHRSQDQRCQRLCGKSAHIYKWNWQNKNKMLSSKKLFCVPR